MNFVQKIDNPANIFKIWLIEDFWGYFKHKVYQKDIQKLRARVNFCLDRIDKRFI